MTNRAGRSPPVVAIAAPVVSALGVYLSLLLDLPTGATIVCTFGLVLVVMALVKPLIVSTRA